MKIVFLDNHNEVVWRLRHDLFASMIHNGCEIIALLPDGSKTQALENIGVKVRPISISRFINPFHDICYLFNIYRLLKEIQPDVVYTNTIKPNTLGMIAATWAGIPRKVGSISGLGRCFDTQKTWKDKTINKIGLMLYRMGGRRTDLYWFQNDDDMQQFQALKIVPPEKSLLVYSSGVNTDDFSPKNINEDEIKTLRQELNIADDTVVITMVCRVDWLKGVGEFLEASRIAQKWKSKVRFLLVGFLDPYNKDSIRENLLKPTETFQWLGKRNDVKNILAISDIVTLPSYYREGVPRSLLEGLAMGKPIVTTNSIGCRETVEDGVNGFLVPSKDATALAAALEILVNDKEKRITFGKESLRKARQEFSYKIVHQKILEKFFGISHPVIPNIKTNASDDNVIFS